MMNQISKNTLKYKANIFKKLQNIYIVPLIACYLQGSHFFYPIKFPDFPWLFPDFLRVFPDFFLVFTKIF